MIKLTVWAFLTIGIPLFTVGFIVGYHSEAIKFWVLSFFS